MGVICACLPTLAPLFQGGNPMQSLMGNVRSFVRNSTQSYRSRGRISASNDVQSWKPPNDSSVKFYRQVSDDAVVLICTPGGKPDDIETQGRATETIIFQSDAIKSESRG